MLRNFTSCLANQKENSMSDSRLIIIARKDQEAQLADDPFN